MYLSKKGKKLYKYYQQYEEDFFLFLGKASFKSDESDIHGLRVTIKKLKGVFKLIELLSVDFVAKKQFSSLKKLFKPAGKIRECQVNLKRLKSFHKYEEFYAAYKKARKKCMKEHRKDFDAALISFSEDDVKKAGKHIKNCCKVISKESIYVKSFIFVEKRLALIDQLYINSAEDIELVHEIRIQLKEISAIFGLLHHIRPAIIKHETLLELKKYESEIGLWHDYSILQDSIDEFCNAHPDEYKKYKSDVASLKSEIRAEEQSFISQLDLFIQNIKAIIQTNLISLSKKIEKPSQTSQP